MLSAYLYKCSLLYHKASSALISDCDGFEKNHFGKDYSTRYSYKV